MERSGGGTWKVAALPALLLAAALAVAGPATAQDGGGNAARPAAAVDPGQTADRLRPGDVIRVRIWREPDLSGEFMVHQDGVAVFPKIGRFQVDTESPATLRDRLLEAYRAYLVNPAIEVILLRRVNILGAVRTPGLYPVDATMTIADAIAAAGGALSSGKPDQVELIRGGERVVTRITGDTPIAALELRSGDQLFVPERHWAARHTGLVATFISAAVTLVVAFAL